jgi:hypothetical protein
MKKKSELLKKKTDEKKRVIEEPDSVKKAVKEEGFVIKVGDDKWLKSWPQWLLCDNKSDAAVLNSDWARGHRKRIIRLKRMKAEIVKL